MHKKYDCIKFINTDK